MKTNIPIWAVIAFAFCIVAAVWSFIGWYALEILELLKAMAA